MGAWSALAADWVGFPIPVKPLKGETLRMRPNREFPVSVWRPSGGTAFQRKDGTISIGATGTNRFADLNESIVRLADDQEPTEEAAADVVRKAVYVVPELESADVVYHLAGPRPLSADAMPIIGAIPGLVGAYVATGHRNKGLHLSAVTAHVIRDLVTGATPTTKSDLTRFAPERFADREVEFDVAGVTRRPA
jgi:glycine/D-amino acid oxidase-like deaminating enzyme